MVAANERYAVFLDIDRTLIGDNFIIPDENLKAIAKARALGHKVFINTGRSWGNIPEVLMKQFDVDGIVAGSGAHIVVGGKTLFKTWLPTPLVCDICEYFLAQDELWCIFEGDDSSYIIPNKYHTRTEELPVITRADDFKTVYADKRIEVIAAGKLLPQDFIDKFSDRLTIFQFPSYADCIVKGSNKSNGMRMVLEEIGIPRERSIAIGDSTNDFDMLKYAGIGVAMENAQPEVKAIADFITTDNYSSGVAFAFEHFLFKK